MNTALNEPLRDTRTARGLTQAQLAEGLGVSANTLARWERGEVSPSGVSETLIRRWLGERADPPAKFSTGYLSPERLEAKLAADRHIRKRSGPIDPDLEASFEDLAIAEQVHLACRDTGPVKKQLLHSRAATSRPAASFVVANPQRG